MAKKLDLSKTQFLFEDNGPTQTLRLFRRKSVLILFGKGEPIRPITYPEWHKLQKDHPAEVKADGLRAESVWTLEEFKTMTMHRMWINQPSTLQPLHRLHGTRVLAREPGDETVQVFFLSGEVISQQVPRSALSQGWPKKVREAKTYYLSGDESDGFSLTLFVVANSPTHAHQLWKEHWEYDHLFQGSVISGQPAAKVDEKLIIYELDYDPDTIGAIPWQDLDLVAYVEP